MGTPNPGTPGEHYFSVGPKAPSQRALLHLHLPDLSLELIVDRGVFSADRVDTGTKLLLSEAPMPGDLVGDVLDVGCGYGPIALTVARRAPATTVWALDVNERALALCAANARQNGVDDRVHAVSAAGIPDDVRFRAIYSNPPIRIGKRALQALLTTWLARLAPDGAAWLVVHKHLGSDSLAAWLREQGYAVERRSSRMGYRILEVRPT